MSHLLAHIRIVLPLLMLSLAAPAQAYIGPGSGLGAIGVMAGMLAAIGLALVGFFWYPLKRLLGKNASEEGTEADATESSQEEPGTDTRP